MDRAIGDYIRGRPPGNPAVLAMTFSKIDPQMEAKVKHTLYTWDQWHPYQLAGGLNWEDIREKEADKIWSVVERYAPNMKGKLIDRYIQTPADIERRHGMLRGNVMHIEMNFDQMFMVCALVGMMNSERTIRHYLHNADSCH